MKMKKFVFLSFFLIFAASMTAQKLEKGSVLPLNSVNKVNFVMEFLCIHGMNEEAFSQYETDWYCDKPEIVGKFTAYANQKLAGHIMLGAYPHAEFTVKAVVNNISVKGDYDCDLVVLDAKKRMIALISGIHDRGGVWGTKLNLIKDGAESTGKKFGSVLKKEIVKSKK